MQAARGRGTVKCDRGTRDRVCVGSVEEMSERLGERAGRVDGDGAVGAVWSDRAEHMPVCG